MARSPYGDIELTMTGLLSKQDAEDWVKANYKSLHQYMDDETPWSINDTIKMHPITQLWTASIKAMHS